MQFTSHAAHPKAKRVDAERCGQAALAFHFKMPLEAKNKKAQIFGDKYDEIFSEETTAETLLLPLRLFEHIEENRKGTAKGRNAWLRYATYHILYAMKILAEKEGFDCVFSNFKDICKSYDKAKHAVGKARGFAKKQQKKEFEDVLFFKSSLAKTLVERALSGALKAR